MARGREAAADDARGGKVRGGEAKGLWAYRDSSQLIEGRGIATQGETSHDDDYMQALIAQKQKQAR